MNDIDKKVADIMDMFQSMTYDDIECIVATVVSKILIELNELNRDCLEREVVEFMIRVKKIIKRTK
jgi:hypothetical protein